MNKFNVNETWNEGEVCAECKSDDRREDHVLDCDCSCHYGAYIRFLEKNIKAENALKRELVEALRNGIVQMKIINGPDKNCSFKNVSQCDNHMWIHRAEELYTCAEATL